MKQDKPYPWYCVECGEKKVNRQIIKNYSIEAKHDGRAYDLCIPEFSVAMCEACGAIHFDDYADEQRLNALRAQVGLLTPDEIYRQRTQLGLTQQQIADALGIASETVSRWESGFMIQSRANDKFLRLFFESPDARDRLADVEVDFSMDIGLTQPLSTNNDSPDWDFHMPDVCSSGKLAA